jgi:UDPglucose 6-dehydrogenase
MRISVIGSGYVGLVAGTCLADSGNDVICVDNNAQKVERLKQGVLPIYEPGLDELVRKNVKEGRLTFSTDLQTSVSVAQVVFIAVGTPEGETGDADLSAVLKVAQAVGRAITDYTVVVDKSTVPVGTADKVRAIIAKETKVPFDVVSNPEFLKEGAALDDFLKPERVVIGADTQRARQVMSDVYAPFVRTDGRIIFMDTRSAELTKYAANAMLATRISFMNDIALLCERVGADVEMVRRGIGSDSRIGMPFLFPGVGYGGSCFPKDVKALVATAREFGMEFDLLRAVERTNLRQKQLLMQKALKHYGDVAGKTFAVWGLAFKPRTDDMREAPAVDLIEALLGKGAKVRAFDPVATEVARRIFGDRVSFGERPYDVLPQVDGLFVVTEWNEFRHPDFERIKSMMKQPVVFDGRNVFEAARMRELGFTYYGIGRQ